MRLLATILFHAMSMSCRRLRQRRLSTRHRRISTPRLKSSKTKWESQSWRARAISLTNYVNYQCFNAAVKIMFSTENSCGVDKAKVRITSSIYMESNGSDCFDPTSGQPATLRAPVIPRTPTPIAATSAPIPRKLPPQAVATPTPTLPQASGPTIQIGDKLIAPTTP